MSLEINNLFSVKGKVAVVTGGSRGIGEMLSSGFLANGAKVYITARKEEALIAKAAELSNKFEKIVIIKFFIKNKNKLCSNIFYP